MARIRTIKPEFFTHEELFLSEKEEKLPLRIAFCGLWTVCDREGRFKWRPNTIKLSVLPFDSVDFSRVLDALASRGFIEQYIAEDGETYGFVPSFVDHQVINNREAESLIPSPFDACATRDPRGLSKDKWKGKERKGKEGEGNVIEHASNASFDLPDWINREHWDLWIKTRKGKKMLPEQMQAQVKKLEAWKNSGLPYWKSLEDSATNGWQGLFEPKATMAKSKPDKFDPVRYVNDRKYQDEWDLQKGGGNGRIIDIN